MEKGLVYSTQSSRTFTESAPQCRMGKHPHPVPSRRRPHASTGIRSGIPSQLPTPAPDTWSDSVETHTPSFPALTTPHECVLLLLHPLFHVPPPDTKSNCPRGHAIRGCDKKVGTFALDAPSPWPTPPPTDPSLSSPAEPFSLCQSTHPAMTKPSGAFANSQVLGEGTTMRVKIAEDDELLRPENPDGICLCWRRLQTPTTTASVRKPHTSFLLSD